MLKKITKSFVLIFVFLMFSFTLVACGGSNNTSGDNNTPGGNSGEAGNGQKTTLKYWSLWNQGEPQQKVIQTIIDEYEEANPNVTIEVEWMGRKVLSKVQNAILSNDTPDILDHLFSSMKKPILEGGLTESLNHLLTEQIPNENVALESVFTEGLIDSITIDGTVSFIPYEVISSGFFYDENLFKQIGAEAPKTWEEFIELNEKLKSQGIPPLSLDGTASGYNASYYYWLATRIGGVDALQKAAGDTTGETWNDPVYLEAAQKVQQLVDNGYFMDGYSGSQYPAAQTAWAQGKAGLNLNGTWLPSETSQYASDNFNYRVFAFPEVEGGKGSYNDVEIDTMGWVALKGANVEAVSEFLAFAMQKKYQEGIVTESTNISSRNDLPVPDVLSDFEEIINNAESFHMKYAGMTAEFPKWWETVFLPVDNELVFGQISAEQFISKIREQSIKFWKEQ